MAIGWRWRCGLLLIGTGHTVAVASRPGEGRRGIEQRRAIPPLRAAAGLLRVPPLLAVYRGPSGRGSLDGMQRSCRSGAIADAWWAGSIAACDRLCGFLAPRLCSATAAQDVARGDASPQRGRPLPPWARFCITWTIVGGLAGALHLARSPPLGRRKSHAGREAAMGNPTGPAPGMPSWSSASSWVVLSLMVGEHRSIIGLISYYAQRRRRPRMAGPRGRLDRRGHDHLDSASRGSCCSARSWSIASSAGWCRSSAGSANIGGRPHRPQLQDRADLGSATRARVCRRRRSAGSPPSCSCCAWRWSSPSLSFLCSTSSARPCPWRRIRSGGSSSPSAQHSCSRPSASLPPTPST